MTVFVYVNANKQVAAAVMEFTDIRVLENPPSVAVLTGPARKLCWSFCFLALLERLLMQLPSPKSINRRRERLVHIRDRQWLGSAPSPTYRTLPSGFRSRFDRGCPGRSRTWCFTISPCRWPTCEARVETECSSVVVITTPN
jgi:hypothetical protein